MKTTLEPIVARTGTESYRASAERGAPTWEYCFLLQDEWASSGGELTQMASAGWYVVSFRVRLDNKREYLLKRPRR